MPDNHIGAQGGLTGSASETVDQTSEYLRKDGEYVNPFAVPVPLLDGTDTAASAPVLTGIGAVSGTAKQLSDTSRDYVVYLTVTTAGTATTVKIGHNSSANDVTIMSSQAATAGQVITFRLPAGWYFEWAGTTTAIGNQVAVGC